jgi:hypothetical protein
MLLWMEGSRQYFISHQLATFASAEDDGHGCVRD